MKKLCLCLLFAALAACSKEEPVAQAPSYYQREMDKQVALDDPARPKRLDRDAFLAETRKHNGNPNPTTTEKFIERYQYRVLGTINNAASY